MHEGLGLETIDCQKASAPGELKRTKKLSIYPSHLERRSEAPYQGWHSTTSCLAGGKIRGEELAT